jgi:hypothetical protein
LGGTISQADLRSGLGLGSLAYSSATIPTTDTVSGWGFTKNKGTVTHVKINGSVKSPINGVVDLGTVSGEGGNTGGGGSESPIIINLTEN